MPALVAIDNLLDFATRASRRFSGRRAPDYRELLFADLRARLAGKRPRRILEIGPRDGEDTRRLLTLNPDILVLVDLPDKEAMLRQRVATLGAPNIELIIANIMYDERCAGFEPFDVVWCTGVLYHNPEQLRMVKRLFDFTRKNGVLVIESATARRRYLRDENCVEIWHGVPKATHSAYHVSTNITHLPTGGPGIVYAFGNNLLHKGGFPEVGEERYVCVFHIYPSCEPTNFERYRASGVPKLGPLPKDPAF